MDENQNSISKHTNNTPFVVLETKKRMKRQKRKQAPHSKTKGWKTMTWLETRQKSVGYWWSSPKFYSPEEKRKMHRHQTLLNRKTSKNKKKWRKPQDPIKQMFALQQDWCQD